MFVAGLAGSQEQGRRSEISISMYAKPGPSRRLQRGENADLGARPAILGAPFPPPSEIRRVLPEVREAAEVVLEVKPGVAIEVAKDTEAPKKYS